MFMLQVYDFSLINVILNFQKLKYVRSLTLNIK